MLDLFLGKTIKSLCICFEIFTSHSKLRAFVSLVQWNIVASELELRLVASVNNLLFMRALTVFYSAKLKRLKPILL